MFGGKGRHHRSYSAPLIDRLNRRCQPLFGDPIEENFSAPADIPSNELLGLEYLFAQSIGESASAPFSLEGIVEDGPGGDEEVVMPGHTDPEEDEEVVMPGHTDPEEDEAYQSAVEANENGLDATVPHILLTNEETSSAQPPAIVSNYVSAPFIL